MLKYKKLIRGFNREKMSDLDNVNMDNRCKNINRKCKRKYQILVTTSTKFIIMTVIKTRANGMKIWRKYEEKYRRNYKRV